VVGQALTSVRDRFHDSVAGVGVVDLKSQDDVTDATLAECDFDHVIRWMQVDTQRAIAYYMSVLVRA
jgi:hypothetical protein